MAGLNSQGRYAIEISFDDQVEAVYLDFPSWIHFEDSDANAGLVYIPGTYYLYPDIASIRDLPREGYIQAVGTNSQQVAQIHVKQTA
jgi:hypothetical protein